MVTAAKMTKEEAMDRSFVGGKTLLLTGGTAGLGAACVDEMCSYTEGKPTKVILVARNATKAEKTAKQLNDAGIATSIYYCDMYKPTEVRCDNSSLQNDL
jgi:short-subunit dehydrogenase